MPGTIEVEEGTGNVFADLGLPNPEERLAKADVAICIAGIIRARRLTQANAARILKIDQPKISPLLCGQLSGFSTERLMQFRTLLGRDIEMVIKRPPSSRCQGHVRVVATVRNVTARQLGQGEDAHPEHRYRFEELQCAEPRLDQDYRQVIRLTVRRTPA